VSRPRPAAHEHPTFARAYLRVAEVADARGTGEHRRRLVAGLSGTVLEVGVGPGGSFRHYPREVAAVVALEPEPTLRQHALRAAGTASVPVGLVAGTAEQPPLAPGSVDAVVYSLVLCSVPDQRTALEVAFSTLRPGGDLVAYEHVRSRRRLLGFLEDAVTPVWARFTGGCHPNRDTVAAVRAAGFDVHEVERFRFSPARGVPATEHVIVRARRPAPIPRT
jgi:SAM-dependent methyltransferase